MEHELKPGMRVRITDPDTPCEKGTLVCFNELFWIWLVRLDEGGWSWGDGWSKVLPDIPAKDGEGGFKWVADFHVEPITDTGDNDY